MRWLKRGEEEKETRGLEDQLSSDAGKALFFFLLLRAFESKYPISILYEEKVEI